MAELSDFGRRMVYSGFYTMEEWEQREEKIQKKREECSMRFDKYQKRENVKKQEIEKVKKRKKNVIVISAVLIVGAPSVIWLMATDFAFPVMLYGSVGPSFIFWLPIAGIMDYYYNKKIKRLETELKLIQREKPDLIQQNLDIYKNL